MELYLLFVSASLSNSFWALSSSTSVFVFSSSAGVGRVDERGPVTPRVAVAIMPEMRVVTVLRKVDDEKVCLLKSKLKQLVAGARKRLSATG